MRARDFILESEGGIIRRAQEVSQGKTITFAKGEQRINLDSTMVIPADPEVRYDSEPELEQGLKDALAELGNPNVQYFGKATNKSGAALITIWTTADQQKIAFVKFANAKKAGAFPITWTNADFGRETGYQQADNKIAERAQFKLKPTDLFQTDVDLNILDLPNSLKERSDLSPEINQQIKSLLENVATGRNTPVPGAEQYLSTYEIDLGESAAPIALSTGRFVSGSYQEAEQALLAPIGLKWTDIQSVIFPGSGSQHLYDSYLRLDKGNTLKVSSKDKKGGAAAAVTGLIKDIEENPERFASVTSNRKFQEILKIVKIVAENSAVDGPLKLAVQFELIDATEAAEIKNRWGKGLKYTPDAVWAKTPGIVAALKRKGAKFEDPAYDFGYHMLAGVAELVADRINQMPGVSDFFKAVLERSTMVQVKARMQKSGNGAAFTNFQVIYPPVFEGSIKVVASNNYMATRRPIGKLSFKIA
jgi:hypothetical protein